MIKAKYTTLIVKDLDESVAFYRDCLGFKEGYFVDNGPMGKIRIMDSELASVELIECDKFPVGMWSIGTDVDDLEKTLIELKEKGIEPISPVTETSVGHMCFVVDPDNNKICLIEHDKIKL